MKVKVNVGNRKNVKAGIGPDGESLLVRTGDVIASPKDLDERQLMDFVRAGFGFPVKEEKETAVKEKKATATAGKKVATKRKAPAKK